MGIEQLLLDLQANNAKSSGYLTIDQLRSLASQTSVDLAKPPGSETLLYSGGFGARTGPLSLDTTLVAENIGANSNGMVRTIGQTDAGKLLSSPEFLDALKKAGGEPAAFDILYGAKDSSGHRISVGLFDEASARFVDASEGGRFRTLTPFALSDRVFAQTEFPRLLADPRVESINGVSRQTFIDFQNELLGRGYTAENALSEVRNQINNLARGDAVKLAIGRDSSGSLLIGTDAYFADSPGYRGVALPSNAVSALNALDVIKENLNLVHAEAMHAIEMARSSTVLSALERGTISAVEATERGLGKLGTYGAVLSLVFASFEAGAATAAGNANEAMRVMSLWTTKFAASLAAGAAAASSTAAYFSWLQGAGQFGVAAQRVLALGAGIVVGVFSDTALEQLFHRIWSPVGEAGSGSGSGIPSGAFEIPIVDSEGKISGFRYEIPISGTKLAYGSWQYSFASGVTVIENGTESPLGIQPAREIKTLIPRGEGFLQVTERPLVGDSFAVDWLDVNMKSISAKAIEVLPADANNPLRIKASATIYSPSSGVALSTLDTEYLVTPTGPLTLSYTETVEQLNGNSTSTRTNPTGAVLSVVKRYVIYDEEGKSYLEEVTNKVTGEIKLVSFTKDPVTGEVLDLRETTLLSAADASAQRLQDELFADAASFLSAARANDKVGMLLSGAKMAADFARTDPNQVTQFDGFLGGVTSVVGVLGALQGLKSDNALTQVGSAVSLLKNANDLIKRITGGSGFLQGPSLQVLNSIGAILSIANLANLGDMLDNGQVGSAAFAAVNAINGAAYLGSLATTVTSIGGTAVTSATGAGAFIPIDATTLVIMIVAVVILDGIFAEDEEVEEPPPPPPYGQAVFKRLEDGSLGYEVVDAGNGGYGLLAAKMDELLVKLNQQVAQANNGNTDPDQALILIASRMPKISLQSWPSKYGNLVNNYFFVLEMTHPQTGGPVYSGISRLDIVEHFAESLVLPEAIVSQWQVNHLAAKFGADERNWKTEGQWLSALSPIEQQRVSLQQALDSANAALETAKQPTFVFGDLSVNGVIDVANISSLMETIPPDEAVVSAAQAALAAATAALDAFASQHPQDPQLAAHIVDPGITDPALRAAAIEGAARQWLKVIAVDLGDDGVTKVALPNVVKNDYESLQTDGVARFDADNDGFREATEWVAPSEAMLGIDRDGNGLIDTASELFNGVSTPFDQRGLASLKYFDSNNDGKIDATDPVYKLLRLWIDLNGDGSAGSMETYDLQMRHPGVDMAALRARLDAAGQAAMDALANSAVVSIDLATFKLRMADGTDAQASEVGLQAHTEGIAVVRDEPTQNVSIIHENGLRENYITLVQDMSVLLELQSTSITAARRAELEALALRYGLNTQSADFINVVKSLRTGGENVGASGMSVYIGSGDVWVDPNVRQRLEQMRFSFHGASTVGGADVFGTASFNAPVWAGPSTNTPVFNDQWALGHQVTTDEVTSDTPVAGPPPPPNPEQWVLPTDVYTLDYVVKGAQLGGLVTQQAVIASNAATPGAPAQTIQVYTTASPTSSLATATIAGREDEQFAFGYEQLEQEARTLIVGGTPYTTVRLLGVRAVNHGYVEVDDVNGRIRFIGDANYYGAEAGFSYAIMDGQGQVMERRINFNLTEVNDAPTLLGETIDAREDVPLLLDAATLLANDSDLEGDTLTIIGIGRVGMGRAELLPNGQISYRPPMDLYDVTDTIEYIVQDARGGSAVAVVKIRLTGVDDAPTVVSEVIRNAKEDTNLRIDAALLLANDFDPDFNAQAGAASLSITAVGNGVNGQAFLDGSGQIIFVPDDNFNGTATFEYTVTDNTGLSTTGKAEVEVGTVNDGPRAFGEIIESHEDQKLVIAAGLLLANDEDIDVQRGEQQHLSIVAVDQAVNGVVSLENGHVVFTPASNFSGEASFRYTVGDGAGGFSQAIAKVNVAAVNDGPTLFNRGFQGTEETPINITLEQLLDGVVDIEDGANGINFVEAKNAVGGTLERTGDTFTFTPGANFTGVAQFDYVVEDAQGTTSTAVVTMSFNNVNDAPVFVAGSHITTAGQEDQELRISLTALKQMFVDVDGDAISVDTANLIAVNAGDTIRYDATTQEVVFKAKTNANGIRQFDVRVQDSNGAYSAYERLNVNLLAMNDTPVVNAVGFEMLEDGGYTAGNRQAWSYLSYSSLLSGSSDAENDVLSVLGATSGRTLDGRSVSIVNDAANNRVGIMAPLNYNGAFTFDFTVGDGQGAQVTQKAYGNVVAVNDLATATAVYLYRGTADWYRLDVTDVEDGANVSINVARQPVWGDVQLGYTNHLELVTHTVETENGTNSWQQWELIQEAAGPNFFGWDPLESTCRHASLSIL